MGRFAYLIGSARFQPASGLRDLVGPIEDVRALKEELCRPDRGDFAVIDFFDRPTYDVARELYADLKNRTAEDVVLVYFSGHGLLDEDGHLFLSGANTEASNVAGTGLRALDVLGRMQHSGALRRILILDCCYSGAIGSQWTKDDVASRGKNEINEISRSSGTYILTSSTDTQLSLDGKLGLFTKVIVTGIKTGEADLDQDGEISLTDLSAYASQRVPVEAGQNPKRFDLGGLGPFVISKSGRSPLKERRRKLKETLEADRQADRISNNLYTFIFARFDRVSILSNTTVEQMDALIDQLLGQNITLGQFYDDMRDLAQIGQKLQAPPPQTPEPPPAPPPPLAPPSEREQPPDPSPPEVSPEEKKRTGDIGLYWVFAPVVANPILWIVLNILPGASLEHYSVANIVSVVTGGVAAAYAVSLRAKKKEGPSKEALNMGILANLGIVVLSAIFLLRG